MVEVNICRLIEYIYITTSHEKKEENSTISPAKRRNHKRHLKSDPQIKSWIEIIEVEVRFQVDGTPRMINSTKPCHSSIVYNIVNPWTYETLFFELHIQVYIEVSPPKL